MNSNVTIYDIAKSANVSIATVSRVINGGKGVSEKTKKRVEAAIKEYNYAPSAIARGLANNTTNTIGILVDDIRKPYYAATIYGMERKLNSLGFITMLCNTGGDFESNTNYLKLLTEKKVDGIALVASTLNVNTIDINLLKSIKSIPIVAINTLHNVKMDNLYHIVRDEAAAINLCIEEFVKDNRKRILFVEATATSQFLMDNAKTAFNNSIRQHGLRSEDAQFFITDRGVEQGKHAYNQLRDQGFSFDAMLCRSATTAIGFINGIINSGLSMPKDISAMVMTDSPYLSIYNPGISAVAFKHETLGYSAATILHDVIKGDQAPKFISIQPDLNASENTD